MMYQQRNDDLASGTMDAVGDKTRDNVAKPAMPVCAVCKKPLAFVAAAYGISTESADVCQCGRNLRSGGTRSV